MLIQNPKIGQFQENLFLYGVSSSPLLFEMKNCRYIISAITRIILILRPWEGNFDKIMLRKLRIFCICLVHFVHNDQERLKEITLLQQSLLNFRASSFS